MTAEKRTFFFSFPAGYFACLLTMCTLCSYDPPIHACLQICAAQTQSTLMENPK